MKVRPANLLLVVVLLLCGSGCYVYEPTETPAPPQGAPLRVELTTPRSFELLALTAHNIGRIEGEMIRRDEGRLFLSATWLEAVTGEGFSGNLWTVSVDDASIASLQVKKASWWRTGIVAAGVAVGTWLGFDALNGSSGGGGQGGGGGSTK